MRLNKLEAWVLKPRTEYAVSTLARYGGIWPTHTLLFSTDTLSRFVD